MYANLLAGFTSKKAESIRRSPTIEELGGKISKITALSLWGMAGFKDWLAMITLSDLSYLESVCSIPELELLEGNSNVFTEYSGTGTNKIVSRFVPGI